MPECYNELKYYTAPCESEGKEYIKFLLHTILGAGNGWSNQERRGRQWSV